MNSIPAVSVAQLSHLKQKKPHRSHNHWDQTVNLHFIICIQVVLMENKVVKVSNTISFGSLWVKRRKVFSSPPPAAPRSFLEGKHSSESLMISRFRLDCSDFSLVSGNDGKQESWRVETARFSRENLKTPVSKRPDLQGNKKLDSPEFKIKSISY